MALVKTSDFVGGAYFKPLEHMNDLALLIEPKSIQRDVPNTYQNRVSTRDEVLCDVTVFGNTDALRDGKPSEFIKAAKFTHGMLTDTLSKIMGESTICTIAKIPTQNGSGYVFRDASDEATVAATAYYDKRNAELDAAMADAPDFD